MPSWHTLGRTTDLLKLQNELTNRALYSATSPNPPTEPLSDSWNKACIELTMLSRHRLLSPPHLLVASLLFCPAACSSPSSEATLESEDTVAKDTGTGGFSCLAEGTRIATPEGSRAIEELSVGDTVLSHTEAGILRANRVTHIKTTTRSVGELRLPNGETLRATEEHPIFERTSGDYLRADSFSVGAGLVALGKGWEAPTALAALSGRNTQSRSLASDYRKDQSVAQVFDLTVERDHNYFAEGVLVHNKSPSNDSCDLWLPPVVCPESEHKLRYAGETCGGFVYPTILGTSAPSEEESEALAGGAGGQGGSAANFSNSLVVSVQLGTSECIGSRRNQAQSDGQFVTVQEPGAAFQVFSGSAHCQRETPVTDGTANENGLGEFSYGVNDPKADQFLTFVIERGNAECYGVSDARAWVDSTLEDRASSCETYLSGEVGRCILIR